LQTFEDWVLHPSLCRPGKRVYSRFEANGDLVFMEEWDDEIALEQAAEQREMDQGKNVRNLAVIPDSVKARALREGWYWDPKAWKRWMNDIDNRKLRVTEGRA
jgi:hypothetical protein